MNIKYLTKQVSSLPPHVLIKKGIQKLNTVVRDKLQKMKDLHSGDTNIKFDATLIRNSYIDFKQLDTSGIDSEIARYLSQMYCEHRFDLLGSGWVENSYDSIALGVEGFKYDMNVFAPKSIAAGYKPIDWQKDYKSGFRWSEKVWYKDQLIGHKLGCDIKVPWELARLQHLPQLAVFSLVDERLKEQNLKEFKNQVLDFVVNNAPRMGVNWICTMDVGIRVSNMLVAYDIFSQIDSSDILDNCFKQIFTNSIYEHGLHIVNNLEYSESLTSNHYLSDIAGLLFVSAYLDNTDKVNQWLAFSIQEIINEMQNEFYEDGGNFESSTSYHRLSGELMAFSTAVILGLKGQKLAALKDYTVKNWNVTPRLDSLGKQQFEVNDSTVGVSLPQWYIDRLFRIGRFAVDLTKANGQVPQFGDNDNGRFFRVSPTGNFMTNKEAVEKYLNLQGGEKNDLLFWDENMLDHSSLIGCFKGIFDDSLFKNGNIFEDSFIRSVSGKKLEVGNKIYQKINTIDPRFEDLKYKKAIVYDFSSGIGISKFTAYPSSGIYIFKSDNFHLAICGTPLGQKGNGGHSHNDKLSYELWYDGEDLALDPGTYLYTPFPDRRNEFRTAKVHNVPYVRNIEQNNWANGSIGLFSLYNESVCTVMEFGSSFIELALNYKNIQIIRRFELRRKSLEVIDTCNMAFSYGKPAQYSNGYGKVMKNE